MKKFLFCISLVVTGLMASCVDKYEEVDADSKPSWLGGSIYAELKNPNPSRLTGTFNTYLRLVDDLGLAETLNRTGSKTVFPANDEAFERFFQSNDWNVSSYDQLSEAQKKLLLNSSMLENAMLLSMLPNAYNETAEPAKGAAIKHATTVSAIDTIQHLTREDMPKGTKFWEKYYDKGIDIVYDATRPQMVHLTREFMLDKGITTLGENSDFAIITGTPYAAGNAYIFNVGIMKNPDNGEYNADRTCLNGYIHQVEDVLVPPGNMGQVLRRHDKTKYFSRILDHYAVPFYSAYATEMYNNFAKANGMALKDSIFEMRYLSTRTHNNDKDKTESVKKEDINLSFNQGISTNNVLRYDPGWNKYFPAEGNATKVDISVKDIGAFIVPDDEAVEEYFLPGGGGSHLMAIYGDLPNTKENLMVNLDSLHAKMPNILTSFVRMLMRERFTETAPSMFANVPNDAGEAMGLTLDLLDRKDNGKYDITIANNGVIYVINQMIVPDEHRSVMAPASQYPDMSVMRSLIQDSHDNGDYLSMDFRYYLMAMNANYAFFTPDDAAFDYYYLDPTSMGHRDDMDVLTPSVLHFYFDEATAANGRAMKTLKCMRHNYNIETGEIDANGTTVEIRSMKTLLQDILNFHTVVLKEGETLGSNHYYKTKHGGTVYVDGGNVVGTHVMSGMQKDLTAFDAMANMGEGVQLSLKGFPQPEIKEKYEEKNGYAYRVNRVIQPPVESVYGALKGYKVGGNSVFSEFIDFCTGFDADQVLDWAGVPDSINKATGASLQDAYKVFTSVLKTIDDAYKPVKINNACLDYNVKMFNTYNYTLFAPDNTAMQIAYAAGLPQWTQVMALYDKYDHSDPAHHVLEPGEQDDKDKALKMMDQMLAFVRYHFMTNSVYADNSVPSDRYQTLFSDKKGVAHELVVGSQDGVLTVSDGKSGHKITVKASDAGSRLVNKMTRDYWFTSDRSNASAIQTSSFCAVHQISEPLYYNNDGRFDK